MSRQAPHPTPDLIHALIISRLNTNQSTKCFWKAAQQITCQLIANSCCDDAPLRRQNNDRIVVQKSMTRYYTVKMVSIETTRVKYSLKLMHSIYNLYFRDNLYIVISFAVITKLKAASVVVTWQPKSQATGKCTTTTKPAILQ